MAQRLQEVEMSHNYGVFLVNYIWKRFGKHIDRSHVSISVTSTAYSFCKFWTWNLRSCLASPHYPKCSFSAGTNVAFAALLFRYQPSFQVPITALFHLFILVSSLESCLSPLFLLESTIFISLNTRSWGQLDVLDQQWQRNCKHNSPMLPHSFSSDLPSLTSSSLKSTINSKHNALAHTERDTVSNWELISVSLSISLSFDRTRPALSMLR